MTDFPVLMFVEETAAFQQFNVLLYGPPGSGKTVAATSAPPPVIVLNAEGPGALAKSRSMGRDIRELRFEGRETLRPFCEYVKRGQDGVRTVVLDTIGAMHRRLLTEIGGAKPQIQHYGEVNKIIGDLVLFLRDRPVNVVLCCHEKIDDQEGDRIVRPLTGGQQLPEMLMAEVDIVGYCGVVPATEDTPVRYRAQLIEARGRRAKDRSGALGEIRDLDLTDWLEAYAAAMNPATDDIPWELPELDEAKGAQSA